MSKHKRAATHGVSAIAEHAQELLAVTADMTGEKVAEVRERLTEALEYGKDLYDDARDEAVARVKVADNYIRANPYTAVGIGVGAGVLLGFLLRGRNRN